MKSIIDIYYLTIKFIIVLSIVNGCANVQPPSGGLPDKTAPEIIENEPANGTLNFSGNSISLKFNKYMNKNEVSENVFISPEAPFTLDWSGKELEIEFTEPLAKNTTYALTLGTEYTDLRQNKPAEAYTLIFSTGNVIDSGIIKGRLFDKTPSGVFIFCYKINGMNPDTLNISHTKPYSRIQVGTNGNFEFHALQDGLYRLFSVRDKFKDGIYDNGMDDFGAAGYDINLKQDSAAFINMKIGPAIDKIGPQLNSAEAISNRRFLLEFNENIDTFSVDKSQFMINDSQNTKSITIESANIGTKGANFIELLTNTELDTITKWFISVQKGIKDTVGNAMQDTNNKTFFYSIAERDTLIPKLLKQPFKDSTLSVNPDQSLDFIFNIAIDTNVDDRIKIHLPEGSKDIPFEIIWKDDNYFSVKPKQILQSDMWYNLTFEQTGIKATNGLGISDSTLKIRFKTKDIRSYGGISGTLKGNYQPDDNYIIDLTANDKSRNFSTISDKTGKWEFENIPPGLYSLEVFIDKDNNGKYSYGEPFPFKYSEKFIVFEKEIEVKPRWNVEDLILTLP
ncbi:MAG: hypothetical protein EPN82_03405 [Bacteroidetes bacterium]|nr:MAG: hypothetical protein EPN82_03405 [Bacteroidota bacterium]